MDFKIRQAGMCRESPSRPVRARSCASMRGVFLAIILLAIASLSWSVHQAHREYHELQSYTEVTAAALGDQLVRSIQDTGSYGSSPESIQRLVLPHGVVFATLLDSDGRLLTTAYSEDNRDARAMTLNRPVQLAPGRIGILRVGVSADPLLSALQVDLKRTVIVNSLAVGLTVIMAFVVLLGQRSLMLETVRERSLTEAVLIAMDDAVVVAAPDGRVRMANPKASRMVGTAQRQLIGKRLEDTPYGAIARDLSKIGARSSAEITLQGDSNMPAFASLITVRAPGGEKIGEALVVHDLTAAKRLESERQTSRSLTAFARFAETVAHEVRNPLNAIAVGVQRLRLEGVYGQDGAESSRMLELIEYEVRRLDEILRGFLDLARPARLDPQPGDLDSLLESLMPFLRQDMPSGVRITFEGSGEAVAIFDPRAVHQVVLNLVRNAVEAVGHRGRIDIVTRREGDDVVLEVQDDGPGIPAAIHDRLFEFGFTTKPAGHGVGLPLVLRLVNEMSGRVEIGSSARGGARLGIALPRAVGIECGQG